MNAKIPKRIIQIWGGESEIPLLGKATAANMTLLNPDFEYVLFDNNRIESFINSEFPEYRGVFDSFLFPIQRYDFLRYLIIYRFGGFYFDMDVILASNISELSNFGCVFPFERLTWSNFLRKEYGMDWEIGNYAFGATAGHPFLEAIIKNCIRAQEDQEWREEIMSCLPKLLRDDLFVIYTTGPGLVSRTLAENPNLTKEVKVLFPDNVWDKDCWNLFGEYGIHLGAGNWRKKHGNWQRRLIGFFGRRNENYAIKVAQKLGQTRSLEYRPES